MAGYRVTQADNGDCIVEWNTIDGDRGVVTRATREEALEAAQVNAEEAMAVEAEEWRATSRFRMARFSVVTTVCVTACMGVLVHGVTKLAGG